MTVSSASRLALPLVSIVVTAHNYGRFLRATIGSIRAQTYRDIECIVVNDGSTDDTAEVLAELKSADPLLTVITNAKNLGQGAACHIGLRASRGQYVVFMDSDDTLAPDFVLDHIYVHLSSRTHVGFTSSDIHHTVDDRIVLSTGSAFNDYILAHEPVSASRFRPMARLPDGHWDYDRPDAELLNHIFYVPPGRATWSWSPTTANLFRRDALNLLADCDELDRMRLGVDVYLCTGISTLCGSLLIDKPLSAYRIHGTNNGSFQAQLQNVRAIHLESELSVQAIELLIAYLTRNAVDVRSKLWHNETFINALESMEGAIGGATPVSRLSKCLEINHAALTAALGESRLTQWKAGRAQRHVGELAAAE